MGIHDCTGDAIFHIRTANSGVGSRQSAHITMNENRGRNSFEYITSFSCIKLILLFVFNTFYNLGETIYNGASGAHRVSAGRIAINIHIFVLAVPSLPPSLLADSSCVYVYSSKQ